MAHSLDLLVVAEGVETAEQLAFLEERHCDLVQGYYFSPPLASNDLEELLEKRGVHAIARDSQALS
jgi:EAL domain-containing protein (putative c-di-GMP-specific phosphodiesterase class I)